MRKAYVLWLLVIGSFTGVQAFALTGPGRISFHRACDSREQITIAAVGDVLLHTPLQKQADYFIKKGQRGFVSLWSEIEPLLNQADLTYANLEGPTAYGMELGSYPAFNYHSSLISDLLSSGVDVVSTANNHSLDRGARGVDQTIEVLNRAGLPFTGTRPSTAPEHPWYTITEQQGFRLAWVACTYDTNGIPDKKKQIFFCYQQQSELEALVRALSSSRDIDAVIVTPHWGQEYQHQPDASQRRLALKLFQAGALAIVGSHPHVVQPWERLVVNGKERFVLYSLGNFVSGQSTLSKVTTVMLYLGLSRAGNGEVFINGVRNVPMLMSHARSYHTVKALDRVGADEPFARQALALSRKIFGRENELGSDERLVTNPECGI